MSGSASSERAPRRDLERQPPAWLVRDLIAVIMFGVAGPTRAAPHGVGHRGGDAGPTASSLGAGEDAGAVSLLDGADDAVGGHPDCATVLAPLASLALLASCIAASAKGSRSAGRSLPVGMVVASPSEAVSCADLLCTVIVVLSRSASSTLPAPSRVGMTTASRDTGLSYPSTVRAGDRHSTTGHDPAVPVIRIFVLSHPAGGPDGDRDQGDAGSSGVEPGESWCGQRLRQLFASAEIGVTTIAGRPPVRGSGRHF